jgi:hypothetical protein
MKGEIQMEVKLSDLKPEAQRIADRLKPSCSPDAAHTSVTTGTGPTRTVTTIHRGGHQHRHGPVNEGEANIIGGKRS